MTTQNPESQKDSIPFYPDHVKTEFYVVVGIVVLAIILGVLGLMHPVGLQEPADPLNTPLHVKPEWYFLFLYQILKVIPPNILGIEGTAFGVVSVMIALVIATLWPLFDRKEDTSKKATWIRLAVTILGLLIVIALTVWGEVS
jgi:quinol-cytochrome oxidoreductase complex cytochrome b subunit